MFQVGLYKRTQGRIARQVTFAALALVVLIGALRLSETFGNSGFYALWIAGDRGRGRAVALLSFGEFAEVRRLFDRRRSRDDQGLVADADRIDPQLGRGDRTIVGFWRSCCDCYDVIWQRLLHLAGSVR